MSHGVPVAVGAGITFLGIALGYWIVVPIAILLTLLAVGVKRRFRKGKGPGDR